MNGSYQRILTVDVGNKTYQIESVSDELLATCLGGKGLATHLLLSRNPAGVDPFSGENNIIIATGPFCGGRLWGGSRYGVYTKSPLTGMYSESYSGGRVPEAIDATGFDAIIFTGKANFPVVPVIQPDGVEFHDGSELWGMDTFETEANAMERFACRPDKYRKRGAVVIGPAGEKLVRYAIIANDKWRCAGRTGVGAVLGSKKIKAIVFQGDRSRQYADQEGVAEYAKKFASTNREHPGVKVYKKMGTTMMVSLMNTIGAFPAKYWSQGTCEHWESISGEKYHEDHEVIANACAKCFMACGRMSTLKKGRHKGLKLEGPEYETIYSFGGLCMVKEMEEVAWLNDICDRLGMDTITAGNLCGLLMEAAEKGRMDYEVEYGNADQIAKLLQMISDREGIGDVLADGIISAANEWNLNDLAIHVKGMEPAGYDPRKLKGMGLAFGTAPRGACHLRTTFYKPELSGMIPPGQVEDKAKMFIDYEDRLNIFDTLTLCRFYRDLYTWEELVKVISLVTGRQTSKASLQEIAGYILHLTRLFNIQEGFTSDQDKLPERIHKNALPEGDTLTAGEMDYMLSDYYRLRGWSKEGLPVSNSGVTL